MTEAREKDTNTAVARAGEVPSEAQCGLFPAPSSYELGEAHQKPTHLRGAEKLQGLPDSAHTATDVEGLKGE